MLYSTNRKISKRGQEEKDPYEEIRKSRLWRSSSSDFKSADWRKQLIYWYILILELLDISFFVIEGVKSYKMTIKCKWLEFDFNGS